MSEPVVTSLIGTGFALGMFHVLTGPDHLSALATLSANIGNCKAFVLGVFWGFGHSTGLILVACILIALSHDADTVEVPDYVTKLFESVVGVFMIVLGFYGIVRAYGRAYIQDEDKDKENAGEDSDSDSDSDIQARNQRLESNSSTGKEDSAEHPSDPLLHGGNGDSDGENSYESIENFDGDEEQLNVYEKKTPVLSSTPRKQILSIEMDIKVSRLRQFTQRVSQSTMSIIVGIIHGLAGPGGVLGVIPAVQLHNWKLATLYLGCFCLSSTLTMGCFAATYGNCSALCGRSTEGRQFKIELFSASLSILVGVTWIVLLSLGKLEDVFP